MPELRTGVQALALSGVLALPRPSPSGEKHSLSELQKGFPLGEEPNITQGKELQRPVKI